MGLFNKEGILNTIRCEESSYLMWKWHPKGTQKGANRRENAIRLGSVLHVNTQEVAAFVYENNPDFIDYIEGPFEETLKTANLPIISNVLGGIYSGDSPFPAEIYFINLARIIQTKFYVPFFDVFDPRFANYSVPVAVRGTISFNITDYREFVKLHKLVDFNLDDFKTQISDAVSKYVKDVVANSPAENNIPVIQIESKTSQINDKIEYYISDRLRENFGVNVSAVDIGAIEINKSSEGYARLMTVTQQVDTETIEAQKTANIRNIYDKQRIEAKNYEESLRIKREEEQYAKRKSTQTANMSAYQTEMQAEVGIAGANALGQMGANGAGGVDIGSGGGFNPAMMMTSMAVGGAVGQNIAGTLNSMMGSMTPPPVNNNTVMVSYYVAENGQAKGPFEIADLKNMAAMGRLVSSTLVWTAGMKEWLEAEKVEELKSILGSIMPPIPNNK